MMNHLYSTNWRSTLLSINTGELNAQFWLCRFPGGHQCQAVRTSSFLTRIRPKVNKIYSSNMEWPKVILFGDSITRRSLDPEAGSWAGYLGQKLAHYFQIEVRGFEGYNSKWALDLMPKLFPKSCLDQVEFFVIFFGHNDSWEEPCPIHVPVLNYDKNMRNIVKYLLDNGLDKNKIILITPTWYDDSAWRLSTSRKGLPKPSKKHEDQAKYKEAILDIARDIGIEVLDFFTLSTNHQPFPEIFCDGLHLSRAGGRLLYDSIKPIFDKKIETKFGKSVEDLWHVVPVDYRPEVVSAIEKYMESIKNKD